MARSSRSSWMLTDTQRENLVAGAEHAIAIHRPLTHWLTLYWESIPGLSPSATVQVRTGHLTELMRKWLGRRGHELVCLWVVESGEKTGGQHVHLLLQLPSAPRRLKHEFVAMLAVWTGVAAVILPRKQNTVAHAHPQPGHSPAWQLDRIYSLDGLLRYVMKASHQRHRHRIVGKRCGVSHAIGATARHRWCEGRQPDDELAGEAPQKPADGALMNLASPGARKRPEAA
jgi:hypothetical protein